MQYYLIGNRELVLAFGLAGVKGAVATTREEVLEVFNRVISNTDRVISSTDRVTGNVTSNDKKVIGTDGKVTNNTDGNKQGKIRQEEERVKVLLISEECAALIQEECDRWQKKASYPLIVEVPPLTGHIKGRQTLTAAISRAVGISL